MGCRWFGSGLRGIGILAFGFGMIVSVPILLEGVTGLVGEGSRLRPESPAQIQARLSFVGGLWIAAIVGWVLARVGTAIREPGSQPPIGVARLVAEVLCLAGGLGLAIGVLLALSPRATAFESPKEYHQLMLLGLFTGPILLATGWGVWRLWVRP